MKFRFRSLLQLVFIGSCFIFAACSSGLISSYYVQQQSRKAQDNASSQNFEGLTPPPAETLEPGKISMFSVILRDGNIAEPAEDGTVAAQLQGKLGGSDASYTGYKFASDFFDKAKLVIENISDNIPSLKFAGQIDWNTADKNENGLYGQWIPGDSFTANGYGVSSVEFRRAYGSHPFGFYKNSSFEVYGADGKPTGEYEPLMKRFVFFYFTGSSSGQSLKNALVAVDTYSKLVFQFAKPVDFKSILGFKIPTVWAPVDSASTWQGKHKPFYEYDPVGYVTQDGVFHMTERYKNNMRNANYDPDFTGISPYVGYVGNSAGEDIKPASSGFLTVKPKYLENVSVTDVGWDHGNADGSDWPEFIYGIRSRAYAGITPSGWDMLAAHKPDSTSAMPPSQALHIEKGTRFDFNTGSKTYEFTMNKEYRTLELDSRIFERDVLKIDKITDYGKPAVYLQYDGFSQSWKVISETLQNTNGTLGFDKNFTLKKDETKELILTIPAPGGEQMKLCYELGWTIEEKPGEKPLFGVEVYKTVENQDTEDTQYTVSGKNGEYTVEYTDQTFESAQAVKEVCFSILLTNLKPDAPVPASFTVDNGGGFIKTTVLKADNAVITSPEFTPAAAVLDVTLSMDAASERADKEGFFTLTFNPPETYNESSPDKIKVKIIRRAYKPKLSVSNIKLKNISVKDIWGDYPVAGGYDKAEFRYEIKARSDSGEWNVFSTNNQGYEPIDKGGEPVSLPGKYIVPIDRKDSTSHSVDISCKIDEVDWGNQSDVIIKHEKSLFTLLYDDSDDNGKGTWTLSRDPDPVQSYNEGGYNGWYWSVKSVTLPKVLRGKKERMTILINAYIYDAGAKGWGDMELSFDVEWK